MWVALKNISRSSKSSKSTGQQYSSGLNIFSPERWNERRERQEGGGYPQALPTSNRRHCLAYDCSTLIQPQREADEGSFTSAAAQDSQLTSTSRSLAAVLNARTGAAKPRRKDKSTLAINHLRVDQKKERGNHQTE